jgi:sterol desaturase/sphingolipid hydroxylase (fatty acid hydroxylase superfamily)
MLTHAARAHSHVAGLFAGIILAAVLVEYAALRRRGAAYPWREAGASVVVALVQRIGSVLGAVALAPLFAAVWRHHLRAFDVPAAAQLGVSFLLVEFVYYWMHRASHRIPWMWATHSVHHSAEHLNLTAGIRLGATGLISGEWLPFVPLVFIGVSPQVLAVLLAFDLTYQFFLHTELVPRLGPLEYVLNTPAHHRIHHARNAAYLNRNFGGALIVFDRLFGTYGEERALETPSYGLAGERRGTNPVRILFAGWARLVFSGKPLAAPRVLASAPGRARRAVSPGDA